VGGIASTVVPQNCEVLASGVFQYSTKDRPCRTYLVKDKELFLMVRILSDASNHLHVQIMERRPRDEHTAIRFAPKLQ
jgi:hypothetical protein